MNMKNFENIFRAALLVILLAALIIAAWHVSWLHKQDQRYEMQITNNAQVVIFDRQERVVYAAYGVLGQLDGKPAVWHKSALPQ